MDNLFIQHEKVITTFIVPWILGLGNKTHQQAKEYIKHGETLDPLYYQLNNLDGELNGYENVFSRFMIRLFNDNNIDDELTKIIGDKVYKPWDCLSGIYKIEITDKMGLVARPNGITHNNECVIMVDNYITIYNDNIKEQLEIKLLSTMAVWKAKKGIYVIKNMCKNISIIFDETKWLDILHKIKLWAKDVDVDVDIDIDKKIPTQLSYISITKFEEQEQAEKNKEFIKEFKEDVNEQKRKKSFERNRDRHKEEVLNYKKEPLYNQWDNSNKNYLYSDFRKKYYHLHKLQFDEDFIKLIEDSKGKKCKIACICGQILYEQNIQKHISSLRHKNFLNPLINENERLYEDLKKSGVSINEYINDHNNKNVYQLI
jgi:hypothetical protein